MSFNSPDWPATRRYGLSPAPGGLALVQDLLNTRAIGDYGEDLLGDQVCANDWAEQAIGTWSAQRDEEARPPTLTGRDVAELRALRAALSGVVANEPGVSPGVVSISAKLAVSENGAVRLEPSGQGWRWLSSASWGEVLLAQQTGGWPRLKVCRNPLCAAAFYDRSKNNSGVWHDVRTCGNRANLRASRARRRAPL